MKKKKHFLRVFEGLSFFKYNYQQLQDVKVILKYDSSSC